MDKLKELKEENKLKEQNLLIMVHNYCYWKSRRMLEKNEDKHSELEWLQQHNLNIEQMKSSTLDILVTLIESKTEITANELNSFNKLHDYLREKEERDNGRE